MATVLGIDLGTTNTSASLILDQQAPIAVSLGPQASPDRMRSAALKTPSGDWLAGDQAIQRYAEAGAAAGMLLLAFKPMLAVPERGRVRWQSVDIPGELRTDHLNGGTIRVGGSSWDELRVESLSATNLPAGATLADVRRATQAMLAAVHDKLRAQYRRISLDHLVIGVPIGFPDSGKEKIIRASVDSGLISAPNKIALLPEPIAVALAYGVEHRTPKRVLVFDHGGGTLDMTIVDIAGQPNAEFRFQVLAQAGHDRAGRYYDRLLLAAILDQSSRGTEALAFLKVADAMEIAHPVVLDAAEQVKMQICSSRTRRTTLPNFTYPFGSHLLHEPVPPALLDQVLADELSIIQVKLETLIAQAEARGGKPVPGSGPGGVQEVLLAGGSSQIPAMRNLIEQLLPGVRVNVEFAGSRTSTQGFARAVHYRKLIDELTDTEYCIYDTKAGTMVPALKLGIPIADTQSTRQQGRPDGLYIKPGSQRATVLLFSTKDERYAPVLQAEVEVSNPDEVLQVIVEVERETGRPTLKAVACSTGEVLPAVAVADADQMPVLEPGQIIRFQNNEANGYPTASVGCIHSIIRMWDAVKVPVAAGEMRRVKFSVHQPDGEMRVWTRSKDIEIYQIDLPRPGEAIRLTALDARRFVPLSAKPVHDFQRVERPMGFESQAAAPVASAPPAPMVPEQVPQQPAPRTRRVIASKLASLIKSNE